MSHFCSCRRIMSRSLCRIYGSHAQFNCALLKVGDLNYFGVFIGHFWEGGTSNTVRWWNIMTWCEQRANPHLIKEIYVRLSTKLMFSHNSYCFLWFAHDLDLLRTCTALWLFIQTFERGTIVCDTSDVCWWTVFISTSRDGSWWVCSLLPLLIFNCSKLIFLVFL